MEGSTAKSNNSSQNGSRSEIKNRGKVDIICDILASAVEGGAKKTHIMYKANLSSEQMKYYFYTLLSQSLLTVDKDSEDNPIYKTTQKGMTFLQCCTEIKLLISSPMEEQKQVQKQTHVS